MSTLNRSCNMILDWKIKNEKQQNEGVYDEFKIYKSHFIRLVDENKRKSKPFDR